MASLGDIIQTRRWTTAALLLLLIGAGLRIARFADDRSLWHDEAMLAASVVDRPLDGLLARPLDFGQSTSPAWLVLAKLSTLALGDTSLALRLPALVAGILALPLIWLLARRWLPLPWAVLALAVCSFAEPLIYYSAEAKHYSLDLLATAGVLWVATALQDSRRRWAAVALALAGALAVALSHPAVFVLAAVGLTWLARAWQQRDWPRVRTLVLIGSVWLGAFAADYVVLLAAKVNNSWERALWAEGHPPAPTSFAALAFWFENPRGWFRATLGTSYAGFCAVLAAIGLIAASQTGRWPVRHAFTFTWMTLLLMVLAATARQYAMLSRLLLFLTPLLALLLAEGVRWLSESDDPFRTRALRTVLLTALLAPLVVSAGNGLVHPPDRQAVRPALETLARDAQPGDVVFVTDYARHAFNFYARADERLRHLPRATGSDPRFDATDLAAALAAWRHPRRVWVVLAPEEKHWRVPDMRIPALEWHGRVLAHHAFFRVSLWLFESGAQ